MPDNKWVINETNVILIFAWYIIKWLIAINFDVNIEKRWERARAFEMWTTTTATTIMSDNDRTASWLHFYWRTIVLAVSCTYSRQLLMFSFRNFKCLRSLLCARHMYIFFYWFSHSVFDLNTRPENWIALLIHNNQLQLGILCMEQSYALMSYTHAKYAYRCSTRATHSHAHTNAHIHELDSIVIVTYCISVLFMRRQAVTDTIILCQI